MKNLKHTYSTTVAATVAGLPESELAELDVQGLVVPSIQRAGGPGRKRLYSRSDLYQLAFIAELYKWGCNRKAVGAALAVAHASNGGRCAVLHRGPVVLLEDAGDKLPERAVLVDPSTVRERVDLALAALGEPVSGEAA